jgi:hypothetical protein
MILATGVFNFTRERPWSRSSISSRVGGAAIRSTSASRSPKRVVPDWAARGFDRPVDRIGHISSLILFDI